MAEHQIKYGWKAGDVHARKNYSNKTVEKGRKTSEEKDSCNNNTLA